MYLYEHHSLLSSASRFDLYQQASPTEKLFYKMWRISHAFLQKRTTLQFPPCCFFFLLSRFDDSVYWYDGEFLSCMTPAKLSDNTFFLSNSDSLLKYLNVDLIDQDRSIKSFPYGSSLPKFSNVK